MKTALPYAVKCALVRVQGPEMGVILSSYEEDIFSALETKFPGFAASLGMTKPRALVAIGKAAFYYRNGYSRSRDKAKSLRDAISKDMKATDAEKLGVLRLLVFMEEIKKPEFPLLATYLSPEKIGVSAFTEAATATVKETAAKVADRVKDAARETVRDAAGLVKSSIETVSSALPWYFSPKLLIPMAAGVLLLIYGRPLLSMIKGPAAAARKYISNPLPASGRRKAAAEKYEEFNGFKSARRVAIPEIDTSELVELGKPLEIGYRSKKWTGKAADYLHEFEGKGLKLLCTPDGKTLLLTGPGLRVTNRGIQG